MTDFSVVRVVFKDGEVREYQISAGPGIIGYLNREAMSTGFLTFWGEGQSYSIPISSVREYSIQSTVENARRKRAKKEQSNDHL